MQTLRSEARACPERCRLMARVGETQSRYRASPERPCSGGFQPTRTFSHSTISAFAAAGLFPICVMMTSGTENSTAVNVLINRAAAERFGYSPQSALGKTFFDDEPHAKVKRVRHTIVGVTADFMFEGDRKQIVPTYYVDKPDDLNLISVRVPARSVSQALSAIDRIWHRFSPSTAINRHFLDADFERQFLADEQQGKMFSIFVGIAIFIACLGLFGLAAFSTERRTKEIGLRKTFGARTRDIILLLLWQFSIPVLVANLIAWPVAYFYLHHWLEGYAYRISLNPLYFIGAGAAALIIAWATVFVHAAHVAKANPIHALRYE